MPLLEGNRFIPTETVRKSKVIFARIARRTIANGFKRGERKVNQISVNLIGIR